MSHWRKSKSSWNRWCISSWRPRGWSKASKTQLRILKQDAFLQSHCKDWSKAITVNCMCDRHMRCPLRWGERDEFYKRNFMNIPSQGKLATPWPSPCNPGPLHSDIWSCCQNLILYIEWALDWSKDHPSRIFQNHEATTCEQQSQQSLSNCDNCI